jgi:hypothetical protein
VQSPSCSNPSLTKKQKTNLTLGRQTSLISSWLCRLPVAWCLLTKEMASFILFSPTTLSVSAWLPSTCYPFTGTTRGCRLKVNTQGRKNILYLVSSPQPAKTSQENPTCDWPEQGFWAGVKGVR